MFSRIATLVPIAALAAVAAAAPNALEARTNGYTCNSGSVYCCDQTISSGTYSGGLLSGLLGLLGIIGLNANTGVNCSPIGSIFSSGGVCTQQAVCCMNNGGVSLVNLSCDPINITL